MRFRLFWLSRIVRRFAVKGRLWVHGFGEVQVGRGTRFDAGGIGIELHALRGARIIIGDNCKFGEAASIEACNLVQIGNRVSVGAWTRILDNNFHTLRGKPSHRPPSKPVIIEDDVTIEARAIVLPGVHLGRGARVSEGAIVHRRVPAGATVWGNPARPMRRA
jgi:acetyltransferase-like isoleucine patch superfamily enzyme